MLWNMLSVSEPSGQVVTSSVVMLGLVAALFSVRSSPMIPTDVVKDIRRSARYVYLSHHALAATNELLLLASPSNRDLRDMTHNYGS